jgi:hypothetical protein
MSPNLRLCKVCDFDCSPLLPWGQDGKSPSYSICPECGVEFGYEDASAVGVKKFREEYLKKKARNHLPPSL